MKRNPFFSRIMDALSLVKTLSKHYKLHKSALSYKSEWQLLVAIILSAQCTDAQVNKVTPALFKALPKVQDMSAVNQTKLEKLIFSTGFYKNKAKNVKAAAQHLIEKHEGKIPATMNELVKVPGVGRKTANVFLSVVHNKAEGVVIDTHIFRVSQRIGVSKGNTAEQVERDVMEQLPKRYWISYGDLVIQHGRKICHARKPDCVHCPLKKTCSSANLFLTIVQ